MPPRRNAAWPTRSVAPLAQMPCGWRSKQRGLVQAMPWSPPLLASSPRSAPFCAPAHSHCLRISIRRPSIWTPHRPRFCLESAATPVRAILPVHLYGQAADWDCFALLKQEHGVLLIEDAAQAFGASWDGRKAGSLGDAAAFSFYPTKNLSAGGDAGMVTTAADTIAQRVRLLRMHGMRRRYEHEEVGWNSRMDTLQAAVLLVKLGFIDEWNAQRRRLSRKLPPAFRPGGPGRARALSAKRGCSSQDQV